MLAADFLFMLIEEKIGFLFTECEVPLIFASITSIMKYKE